MPMNRHWICYLAVAVLVALFLLGMAPGNYTVYLPLVYRQPTPTPTLLPGHYYLAGRVFFDYNGSGLQEQGEPGIQGVPVYVDNLGSALHATTAADGSYSIANVPLGEHQVYVQSPTQDAATAFRYINLFKGWVDIPAYEMNGVHVPAQHLPDTEVQSINQPPSVSVSGHQMLNVALMRGFLTLPYEHSSKNNPLVLSHTDLDYGLGSLRDWSGCTEPAMIFSDRWDDIKYGVDDNHQGTDWVMPEGTPLLAMTDSYCTNSEGGYPEDYPRYVRFVSEIDGDNLVYYVTYGHNSVNLVAGGQYLRRGQIIALSGADAGLSTTHPHVHISAWEIPRDTWLELRNSSILWDYFFGQGIYSGNGRAIPYKGGQVPRSYCPYSQALFTTGNDPQFPLVNLGQ